MFKPFFKNLPKVRFEERINLIDTHKVPDTKSIHLRDVMNNEYLLVGYDTI